MEIETCINTQIIQITISKHHPEAATPWISKHRPEAATPWI